MLCLGCSKSCFAWAAAVPYPGCSKSLPGLQQVFAWATATLCWAAASSCLGCSKTLPGLQCKWRPSGFQVLQVACQCKVARPAWHLTLRTRVQAQLPGCLRRGCVTSRPASAPGVSESADRPGPGRSLILAAPHATLTAASSGKTCPTGSLQA